ncbi:MAG: LysR family transcriptional regulator [Peptococcaceae bacterium]|nr:LysR family transcriptional regulator [Peptococcaceae bacterium]
MEERDWQILIALFEYKNMTKASHELFISQPALTSRIKQMENEFKIRIVNRGSRGVQFTPEGEYLVNYAKEMLEQLRKTKENILNLDNNVKGTLRIGTSKFFGKYKLPRMLSIFKERYPEVDFRVTTGWSSSIAELAHNLDVHVGFVRGEHRFLGHKDLLCQEKLCIAAKFPIDLDNLPNLPRLNYQTEYATKIMLDDWWIEKYSQPPLIVAEVDSVDTCKEMILHGLGYAILSSNLVSKENNLNKMDLISKNGEPLLRKTWLVYHEESLELNIVKAFVNFAKAYNYQV